MKKPSSSRTSKTDLSRVRTMTNRQIRVSAEHPEADVRHIVRGIVRQGLKPVSSKTSISLRVDADVLEWFKAQGGLSDPDQCRPESVQRCLALKTRCSGRAVIVAAPCSPRDGVLAGAEWAWGLRLSSIIRRHESLVADQTLS